MPWRCVFIVALAMACSLYADAVVPPVLCAGGGTYVHHLCSVGGATPANPVNPFDPPVSGNMFTWNGAQSPIVFIEGDWYGHRITANQGFKVDWLANSDQTGQQYSQNTSGGALQFPNEQFPVGLQELYSYYVRAKVTSGTYYQGTLTFEFPIVAVVATNHYQGWDKLAESDGLFQAYDSNYALLNGYGQTTNPGSPTYAGTWGLDDDPNDWIMISQNRKSLTFNFNFGSAGIDSIRILTSTPEPGAVVAFGTVAAALFGALRFRKRRKA